jgi:hypothetical protein
LNRRELRLEKFGWDSFEVTDVLGEGRCGSVFEGTLRGEKVVIKFSDQLQHPVLLKETFREARTYVELGKLQGHDIQKLKRVSYAAGGLFAVMKDFGGWPIKAENLNDEKRKMVVGVLVYMAKGFYTETSGVRIFSLNITMMTLGLRLSISVSQENFRSTKSPKVRWQRY